MAAHPSIPTAASILTPVPIPDLHVGQQNTALFSARSGLNCQVQDQLLGKLRSIISDPGFPSWTPCSLGQRLFPLLPTTFRVCPCLTLPGQSHPYLWPPLISAQAILHSDRCPGFKTSSNHLLGVATGTSLWCPAVSMDRVRQRERKHSP